MEEEKKDYLVITLNVRKGECLLLKALEQLVQENNCNVVRREWCSLYNSYVVYDYQPFCSDDFNIKVTVRGSIESRTFIESLFKKRLETVCYLQKCLEVS